MKGMDEKSREIRQKRALKNERLIAPTMLVTHLHIKCFLLFILWCVINATNTHLLMWTQIPTTHTHSLVFPTLITSLCDAAYIWKCWELYFHTSVKQCSSQCAHQSLKCTGHNYIHSCKRSVTLRGLNSILSCFHLLQPLSAGYIFFILFFINLL